MNRYSSECPRLEDAPLVLYEYNVPVVPLLGPDGVLGVLIVSDGVVEMVTILLDDKLDTTVVCVAQRACALTV